MPSDIYSVIFSHILEHEYEPNKMLAYCKDHMKDGAYIYIEISVLDVPSFRVFGRYWGEVELDFAL